MDHINVEHPLGGFPTDRRELGQRLGGRANSIEHPSWHKKRLTVPRAKIEGLSDNHRFKPGCLFELSRLFYSLELRGIRAAPFSYPKA